MKQGDDKDRPGRDWMPVVNRQAAGGARLALSLAISDYDHVADLLNGRVRVEGVDLIPLSHSVEEIFFRFTKFREWDVSEMSMAKFCSLVSQGDDTITGLPVFPSRMFRHSSIYLRDGSDIAVPADLRGRRVGVPEWAQTASIYSRGFLVDQFGLDLAEIDWVQAGVNQPGRHEKVALNLPAGVRVTPRPDSSLDAMLMAGEIDAVLSAHAPHTYEIGAPGMVRMFEAYREVEEAFYAETGIYPIMHIVAIKTAVLDRFPWVAGNLVAAFSQARDASLGRLNEMTASRYPVPWLQDHVARMTAQFGGMLFPYGIEPNRPTLEAFLTWAHVQGVCHRALAVDELFPPMVRQSYRV